MPKTTVAQNNTLQSLIFLAQAAEELLEQKENHAKDMNSVNTIGQQLPADIRTGTKSDTASLVADNANVYVTKRSRDEAETSNNLALENNKKLKSSNTIHSQFQIEPVPDMNIHFVINSNIKKLISDCGLTIEDFKTKAVLELYKNINCRKRLTINFDNYDYAYPAGLSDQVVLKHLGNQLIEKTLINSLISFADMPYDVQVAIYAKIDDYNLWSNYFEPDALKILECVFGRFIFKNFNNLYRHIHNLNNNIYLLVSVPTLDQIEVEITTPDNLRKFHKQDIIKLLKEYLHTDLNDFNKFISPKIDVADNLLDQPPVPVQQSPAYVAQNPVYFQPKPAHLQQNPEHSQSSNSNRPLAAGLVQAGIFSSTNQVVAPVNNRPNKMPPEKLVDAFKLFASGLMSDWTLFSPSQQQELKETASKLSQYCNNNTGNHAIEEMTDKSSFTC
ncbi:MAG: hypothetical protein ACK4PR_06245 [Gammaproteobacteria bacterium]